MKDPTVSRRTVLLAATAGAFATTTAIGGALPAAGADIGVSVFPFPLGAVTLLPGPLASNTGRTHNYLHFLDPDRLLHMFRLNVGLPSSAQACGGWESPTTQLRGHSLGHVLTALAQAYASTGNTSFKTKGDYIVAQLAICQSRAVQTGFNTGYLAAFPESFIDRVELRQDVWAPYYTLHKIMAGLLDMHLLAGNAQALSVLTAKAAWVKLRNDRLTYAQRQSMLQEEFGGMNEVLTNLYQVSGNANHLTTAQYFDHAQIFDPLASNQDQLDGFHANTQIPKILGAIREYHLTGTTRYRDIAANFWDIVIARHTYANGGNSNGEYFQASNAIATELSDSTSESCNTYNMLKLTRQLFFTNPARMDYLDYYEAALFNHLLGAQNPASANGHHSYYTPLRPGGIKTYSNDYNSFTITAGAATFTLGIRRPIWANDFMVRVNGAPQTGNVITRAWEAGDVVHISTPMALSRQSTPDNAATQAVKIGPILLAGAYGTSNLSALPTLTASSLAPTTTPARTFPVTPLRSAGEAPSRPLQYTATASTGQVTLVPFYKLHGQRYTVYWTVPASLPPFVAHYQFNETSGTAAADSTGNGRTATVAGGATWIAGRTGNAVNLSGSSQYVTVPAGILSGATAFTIAVWVRVDTIANWARLFDFGSSTSANMFFVPRSSANAARFAQAKSPHCKSQ